MKKIILFWLLLAVTLGEASAYGLPPISPGSDSELLSQTPIPLLTFTPTSTPTVTATKTSTVTSTPTATIGIGVPTTTETITLPSLPNKEVEQTIPNHQQLMDPSMQGLNSFKEQGFFEIGLGIEPPIQGWASVPTTGTGAKVAIGVAFKDGFAVQLDLEYFSRSNSNATGTISESEALILPTLRRYLLMGNVRPYLSLGDGLAVETSTMGLNSSSVDSFDLALGGGVEFLFQNSFSTYIEGKYNFVFLSGSPSQDVPVVVGARLGL